MSVIIDSYGRDELAWDVVSLSDPDSVRGLLRLRSHYDLLYDRRGSSVLESNVDLADQLEVVTCVYASLDEVVDSTYFSKQQQSILERYMSGYDVSDIAQQDEQTTQNINGVLGTICRKISEENQRRWVIWVSKNKLNANIKECSNCYESLPLTEDFFRVRRKTEKKIIYRNQCRKCETRGVRENG